VIGEELLRQRLVPGQEQPARIAARVGQLQQLEVADDVLIEDRDVVEPFEEVEGDLRLPLGGRRRMSPRSSWTASICTSWPIARSVVATLSPFARGPTRGRCPLECLGGRMAVNERQDAQLVSAHARYAVPSLCR
jgi:hypothetical protein